MKKIFLGLLTSSWVLNALEDFKDLEEEVGEAFSDVSEKISESLSWKMKLMLYWHVMSTMHKMIVIGLVALVIVWIVFRLLKIGKCSSCTCGCGGGKCNCHDK